jgi:prepilin-type N-terminal cleavage/methylation domain-containing protein
MKHMVKEDGFTLIELLIVTAILGMMAAAIFGVYQVSQQTYAQATSQEDAQLGARVGLEQLATELRLIGAYANSEVTGAGPAITAATATSITFQGDIDGKFTTLTQQAPADGNTLNVVTTNGLSVGNLLWIGSGALSEVKFIQAVDAAANTITLTAPLVRAYPPAAEVRPIERVTYVLNNGMVDRIVNGNTASDQIQLVDNVNGLTLTYFGATGNDLGSNPNLALIREIQISLAVMGTGGSQRTMTSRVRPRNLPFP